MPKKKATSPAKAKSTQNINNASPPRPVPIAQLLLDGGTQTRAQLNREVVEEYAASMAAEDAPAFPPVVVFEDEEHRFWLTDGFHRVFAALRNNQTEIMAEVRPGSRLEALKHSLGANQAHGLRRTNADKRRSVELAFEDEELGKLSSRKIATLCGVGHQLADQVRSVRKRKQGSQVDESSTSTPPAKRVGGDGKKYPAGQPRKKQPSPKASDPAPPQEPERTQARQAAENAKTPAESLHENTTNNPHNPAPSASAGKGGDHSHGHEGENHGDLAAPQASNPGTPAIALPPEHQLGNLEPQQQPALSARWDDGIIASGRVQERLGVAETAHPSNRYTEEERAVFKECFAHYSRAVNWAAEEICARRSVRKQVATDTAEALGKFIATSPRVEG